MRIAMGFPLALLLLAGAVTAADEGKDGTILAAEIGTRLDQAVARTTDSP